MKLLLLGTLLLAFPSLSIFSKHHGYSWKDEPGKHLDLMKGDKKIVRYVYERMDPEDRERTYKPFHTFTKRTEMAFSPRAREASLLITVEFTTGSRNVRLSMPRERRSG